MPIVMTDLYSAQPVRQVSYAIMAKGYMIVADGNPLETSRRETRQFKTLDTAARFLFKLGIADFAVKLKTS